MILGLERDRFFFPSWVAKAELHCMLLSSFLTHVRKLLMWQYNNLFYNWHTCGLIFLYSIRPMRIWVARLVSWLWLCFKFHVSWNRIKWSTLPIQQHWPPLQQLCTVCCNVKIKTDRKTLLERGSGIRAGVNSGRRFIFWFQNNGMHTLLLAAEKLPEGGTSYIFLPQFLLCWKAPRAQKEDRLHLKNTGQGQVKCANPI